MTAKPKTFVRDATGLVRELNWLDYSFMGLSTAGIFPAIALTPFWIYVAVAGGDPMIGIVTSLLFGIFGYMAMYAITSATFPRSAAPYVTQTRVLTPWIGWPSEVLVWLSFVIYVATYPSAFLLQFALIPGLQAMGIATGNMSLVAAANWLLTDITPSLIIGTVFLVLLMLITISGTKRLVRTLLPATIISMIAVVLMIGLLANTSREQFIALTPVYMGNTYQGILDAGKSLPTTVPISWAFVPLMSAAGFAAGEVQTVWGCYAAGEVKRGRNLKMQYLSMVIPGAFIAVLAVITYALLYSVAGRDFMISLVNFSYIGSNVVRAPLNWGGVSIPYIALMLANNFWLQLVITVGLAAAVYAYFPGTMIIMCRDLFAWSFDRLIPAKFSEISDRYHTPVWATIAIFIMLEAIMIISIVFPQYMGTIFTISWGVYSVGAVILAVSGALLPLRKNLWEQSPAKWKLAGIPVVTIVSSVAAFYFLVALYVFTFTPAVGFGLPVGMMIVVLSVIPFVLYWIVRAYRKREGIDFDMIFRTLPPE